MPHQEDMPPAQVSVPPTPSPSPSSLIVPSPPFVPHTLSGSSWTFCVATSLGINPLGPINDKNIYALYGKLNENGTMGCLEDLVPC